MVPPFFLLFPCEWTAKLGSWETCWLERIDLELWTPRDVAKLLTLVENEKRYYQEIIATLPHGVAIVSGDFSLQSVNRAFRRYFQLRHEEAARLSLNDLIADGEVRARIEKVRAAESVEERIPFQHKDPNGVSQQLQLTVIPFPDWFNDGANDLLVVVEEGAGESRSAWLEELPALLWKLDPASGAVEFGNVATPLGRRTEDSDEGTDRAARWSERVYAADVERVARVYQAVLASGVAATVDYRARKHDGSVTWLSDEVRRVAGEPPQLQVLTHDVAERREQALRLAEVRKSEAVARLAGKVSHDFNNILMVIQGNVEEAMQDLPDGDARKESLAEVLKAAERMAGITQQLLGVSRPPAPSLKVVDLNQVLRQMGLGARLECSAEFEPVNVDGKHLELALRELVGSIGGLGGGEVVVSVGRVVVHSDFGQAAPGAYARLRVGPLRNVPAEMDLKWNEPFHGISKGMAQANSLLQAMQVGLRLVRISEADAEYEAWIPLASMPEPAPGMQAAVESPQPAVEAPPARETVMVVDDEDSIRALVARVLRREGYRVLEASSSEEALSVAGEFAGEIALIVSDVMLPQMRGTDLVVSLRSTRPGLRALFMSGYTDDPKLATGTLPKGEAFLQKPFSLAALLQTVRMVLMASED